MQRFERDLALAREMGDKQGIAIAAQLIGDLHSTLGDFDQSIEFLELNMALSNDRAFTVRGYLETHGIAGSRLTSKGYGPTQPVGSNETPAGRAQNRRTEFVITGK